MSTLLAEELAPLWTQAEAALDALPKALESNELQLRWIRRAYAALANLPRAHKSPLAREVAQLLQEATPWVS